MSAILDADLADFRDKVRGLPDEALTPELRTATARQAGVSRGRALPGSWHAILYAKGLGWPHPGRWSTAARLVARCRVRVRRRCVKAGAPKPARHRACRCAARC
jgi:hypothetical protein